jgi:hypothetical protein
LLCGAIGGTQGVTERTSVERRHDGEGRQRFFKEGKSLTKERA